MRYPIGAQAPLSIVVRDATGALVDAATVVVTVNPPTGAPVTYTLAGLTVQHPSLGNYVANHPVTVPGWHNWNAVTTTPATAYGPDSFNASAMTDAPLVSVADVRTELGIASTVTDALLLQYAQEATQACEMFTNLHWRTTTVTETHNGGGRCVVLREGPVRSITTVVENGATLNGSGSDYTLDQLAGVLYRGTKVVRLRWYPAQQTVTTTYVVGPPAGVVPDDILTGVMDLIRHKLGPQRGGSGLPRQGGAQDLWGPGTGYAIPRWVEQSWGPYAVPATSGVSD